MCTGSSSRHLINYAWLKVEHINNALLQQRGAYARKVSIRLSI